MATNSVFDQVSAMRLSRQIQTAYGIVYYEEIVVSDGFINKAPKTASDSYKDFLHGGDDDDCGQCFVTRLGDDRSFAILKGARFFGHSGIRFISEMSPTCGRLMR